MVVDGIVVYRDQNHLTEPFSARLAPRLAKALDLGAETPD